MSNALQIEDQELDKFIGYLKYSGKSVEDGSLDIRKSAEALLGFDEALRYFISKESSSLKDINFEIPVRIRKGSWEAVIPVIIDKVLSPEGVAMTYAATVAKKAAEDGFVSTGAAKDINSILKGALISVQWTIRIACHVGTFAKKKFDNVRINNKNIQEIIIGIPDCQHKYLEVPKKYFDLFVECPRKIFSKNARLIEKERVLEIGVFKENSTERVSVTEDNKSVFYSEDDEILFPELKHGQFVELEGGITRGNEKTNTIGFEYRGHILTCRPANGDLANFKGKIVSQEEDHFCPRIKIIGVVDRTDKFGSFKEKKPLIIFSNIIQLEVKDKRQSLFNKDNL
ncbi:MAG: hypothetical protein WC788_07565 [Candidatus Paceibacterota bacterium]|jgi:hypothetical protein